MKSTITVVLVGLAFGCSSTDDPGFTSVTTRADTGETGDMGETGELDPNCADPEFEGKTPENPTISECAGQGGGALVFDVFSGFGNGVIPDKSKASPTVLFPDDAAVDACCGDAANLDEVAGACASDCARAACNRAIETLEDAVADPSSLQGGGCGANCAMNVASSLEDWVLPQLVSSAGYESCLDLANVNVDPGVDYTAAEFDGIDLTFQRPSDACKNFGCLSNVRLRIYCAVDSVLGTEQMCTMATNDEHPDIPESDRLIVASSPADITSERNGHVEISPATSHGGVLRQDVCDNPSCPLVLETFSLSTDETLDIGSFHVWDLSAKLAYAAIGTRVGDIVEFDTGALQFQISGVTTLGDENTEMPVEFVIANTSPAMATFTGAAFSFEELEFRQGQDTLRVRVHEAPATPDE